ncbi:MAG: hypothetical protein WBI29_00955 [Candidatus Saccharimonadales bacterium]
MSTVSQSSVNLTGSFVKLIEILQQIDISSPNAKLNEESIDDNNGGRIIL